MIHWPAAGGGPNDKASAEWQGMCRVALAPPARSGEGYRAFLLFCQSREQEDGDGVFYGCEEGKRTSFGPGFGAVDDVLDLYGSVCKVRWW